MKPFRAWTNAKRRFKRKVRYESGGGRLIRDRLPRPGGCLVVIVVVVAIIPFPEILGSSGISGESRSNLEEEVVIIPEAISHSFDDFDLVVDPFEETGVQRPTAVGEDS